ncbi:MAG: hypothetical protein HUK21_10085 [Fibrobacteraceae bacterium]|nr:hypothetical protein [Fibrobacteraceae bacterium]
MSGLFIGLLIGALVALFVILFFPFKFNIFFDVTVDKAWVKLGFYSKIFYTYHHNFKKKVEEDECEKELDDYFVPDYVPAVVNESAPKKEATIDSAKAEKPVDRESSKLVDTVRVEKPVSREPLENTKAEKPVDREPLESSVEKKENSAEPTKEKKKLTEEQFWGLLLSPDFDDKALTVLKKFTFGILRLFRVHFEGCFVEGIHSNYKTMGYLAAVNAFIQDLVPVVGDFDFRMDWCNEKSLHSAGRIVMNVNLCRVVSLLMATLFYGSILFLCFWHSRAKILKDPSSLKLGWVRKKIVSWIVE